ncbi:unnamed protein product [Rhizophagus irregularis]|nr:unnamed protein product [Rhizophagus irregularis]
MSSKNNNIDISENLKRSSERTIILNVGGIKYETYASTLTEYPDTLLGTIFQDKNRAMLHPQTDKVTFVTLDEIEKEIEYFRIPVTEGSDNDEYDDDDLMLDSQSNDKKKKNHNNPAPASVLIHKYAGAKVDQFINALEELIYEAMGCFEERIELKFFSNTSDVEAYWKEIEPALKFYYIMKPYGVIGYCILDKFSKEIQLYFESTMQSISFQSIQVIDELTPTGNYGNYYKISINIKDRYDKEDIIIHTRLANYRVS